jgi:hypothetical protein
MNHGRTTDFPFDDCAKIQALASEYWNVIADRDVKEEKKFPGEFQNARKCGYLSPDLFVRVARWKSVRKTPSYLSNTDEEIRKATVAAFQAKDDATAINALKELKGVALRTASAILHWMVPERFPILDYRVMAALGENEPKSYEDVRLYSRIADRVRELADRHSLDLRTMDRALWTWDKHRQGTAKARCRKG